MVKHSLKETIGKIPLFATTLDASFQLDIYPLFKPVFAAPQEVIFAKGDQSFDLLFLLKGVVEVISGVDEQVLYRVQPGDHFGESVLTGRRRSATHRASSKCDMFVISSGDLSELFARRPREGVIIHQSVMAAYHKKENLRVLSLRLQLNRLTGSRPQDAAALRLQLAWNRYDGAPTLTQCMRSPARICALLLACLALSYLHALSYWRAFHILTDPCLVGMCVAQVLQDARDAHHGRQPHGGIN